MAALGFAAGPVHIPADARADPPFNALRNWCIPA
jgi:hypothetical protein